MGFELLITFCSCTKQSLLSIRFYLQAKPLESILFFLKKTKNFEDDTKEAFLSLVENTFLRAAQRGTLSIIF